ncbi:MAG: 50S ribosomal protein L23 [Solirubrobacteraceae bacterium]|nr:50S ribosomal protein L23 [Solirubrobacteraceae bacterium]
MDATQVIIRPVVSEKSYVLSTVGKYTFRVHPDAHKTQIRQAVEELFDVHVEEVRTSSVKSKPKRRGVTAGRTRSWKKAIVQVREGEEIPIFQSLDLDPSGAQE